MLDGYKIAGDEMLPKMLEYREKGAKPGVYLGFPNIDKHYQMKEGTCTDWTGFYSSGKTQFVYELLINTSEFHGWTHLVYMPDAGNTIEVIEDLIHKKTGKSFVKHHSNYISEMELKEGYQWVMKHFRVLCKVDLKHRLTPFEFWELAVNMRKSDGLSTATVDSWMNMKHKDDMRDDKYLDEVLSYRNALAEESGLHIHTVVHPKSPSRNKNGEISRPTVHDINGGAAWSRNGKTIAVGHRENKDTTEFQVYFDKVKPRIVGVPGSAVLNFDIKRSRYYTSAIEGAGALERHYASPDQPKIVRGANNNINNDLIQHGQFSGDFDLPNTDDDVPF